jgi:hypothetical protein
MFERGAPFKLGLLPIAYNPAYCATVKAWANAIKVFMAISYEFS